MDELNQEDQAPIAKSPGTYLKAARMARQWNIHELVRRIKLPAYVVEALEKDDYDAIEAKLFIKGYLRLYAKTVEANEHEAIACFEALLQEKGQFTKPLTGSHTANKPVIVNVQNSSGLRPASWRWLSIVALLGVTLLAGLWWYRTQGGQSAFLKTDLFTLTPFLEDKANVNVSSADPIILPMTVAAVEKPSVESANTLTTPAVDKDKKQ